MIEVGFHKPLEVRVEQIHSAADACRLAYISDIHLRRGRSKQLGDQILAAAELAKPDAILLGGDLVDSSSELSELTRLVASLSQIAPLVAIGGNHDRAVGLARVKQAVQLGTGTWIHDSTFLIQHGQRTIAISGPENLSQSIAHVRVLCAHYPAEWKRARDSFDVVLAGHLHGCQFVAFQLNDYLFPGALFYSQCCLKKRRVSSTLIVSRGVSDLIPIRWCCPREIVVCHV